jgi:alpha-1,2-mannosyltransferase
MVVAAEVAGDKVAVDFSKAFYPAAQDVLNGVSPYTFDPSVDAGTVYVYTPTAAVLFAPFTLLSIGAAQALVSFALIVCFLATPWVLGIRDWRVYGAMCLWSPFVSALQTANLTIVLGLLCALAWRARHRPLASGLLIGLAVALKAFLWPLAVWLLATRRFRSFAAAALLTAVSFASVTLFVGLGDFVQLLREHSDLFDDRGYTLFALLAEAGAPEGVARAVWLGTGLSVLVLGRKSFVACLAAALLLSPIVWLHYFALLVVPLAILRAPLIAWLLPLLMWFSPGWENGEPWQTALVLTTAAGSVGIALRAASAQRSEAYVNGSCLGIRGLAHRGSNWAREAGGLLRL